MQQPPPGAPPPRPGYGAYGQPTAYQQAPGPHAPRPPVPGMTMPAMAAGAPRPGAPGAAPVQGAPFAQPGALPRPAMPPGAPVGAPRPPTPGQPTSMPQRPHVPGQPGTGSLPRSQTPHQLPYASQPGESGPLPQVGAPGMQPGMVPRSGTPYGTHTGMPPPMPQGAPMTAPAAQPPRPGMVSQPTGTYGQAPMMAQAPTMPGQPPMPNMGAAPNAGQPQFQPALVSTPTPPSPTGLGMAPAAHHKPRRAYAAQAYSAAAAAPDQLTAQGMLPGTSAPGPMAYGQAPNGTGLSGPSQLQQPAQPQFFTPGDPMAGAIPGVPGVASTYGQPGVAPGAMLQQPQGAAGGVAALTQGMAALGLAPKQVPSISLFNVPPNPQELEGPAASSWLPGTSSASASPLSNPSGSYKAATLNAIPSTQALLNKSRLPLGLVIAPYRKLLEGDEPVPVINPEMIVRCRRCRTYINPWIQFVEQGTRWRCNLCYLTNEVPGFFDWDAETRQRVDRMTRPELTHSVVEFVAPAEYMVRPPQPCVFFFVIDVSFAAVQSGAVACAARTILASLDSIPNTDNRTKIGFLTVDSTLHFYNLGSANSDPQMLVMPDLEEVFLPQPEDLLVNLTESRKQVEALLSRLGDMFAGTHNVGNALGPALQAAYKLLAGVGGKIVVMNATLPNVGQGALKPREDPKLLGTNKESQLLQPQVPFYKTHAVDCSRAQVSIDMFLFGGAYEDVATLSGCARYTGGACFFYPAFNAARPEDATKFSSELAHFLSKPLGLEAVLRVRASKGVRMTTFHGNFFLRSTDLLALPNVNPDAAYAVECEIEETIQSQIVCFQTAVLHTSSNGERRIRVITAAYPVTSSLIDLFASADAKTLAALLAKKAVDRALTSKLEDARDALLNKCSDILVAYKSAFGGQGGQVAVCENLKMMPILTLATVKNLAFRGGASVPTDVRSQMLALLYMLPVEMIITALHPKFYALHMLPPEAGFPNPETGFITMPPVLNCSSERIERTGAYLLDNGLDTFLWISRTTPPELIQALFDRPYDAIQTGKTTLPMLQNSFSQQVQNIVGKIRQTRVTMATIYPTLYIVKEDGDPALRMWFLSHMIEDRTADGSQSYAQYLGALREQVAKAS